MIMKKLFFTAAFIVPLTAYASPALAKITFCNRSDRLINTALAIRIKLSFAPVNPWVTRGWWSIAPGECKVVSGEQLYASTDYGHYGISADGTKHWPADNSDFLVNIVGLCVEDGRFVITDPENWPQCREAPRRQVNFKLFSVGENWKNYTVNFD